MKFIKEVREYALDHYEEGWDVIVESFTDVELDELIAKAASLEQAIKRVGAYVQLFKEVGDDIRGS